MYDMDKETTEGFANVTETAAEVVEAGANKAYCAVEKGVTKTYTAIEKGVVGAYQAVENAVVGTFNRMTDAIVSKTLTREGETVEEAKQRLAQAQADREKASKQRMEKQAATAQTSLDVSLRIAAESLEASRNAGKRNQ